MNEQELNNLLKSEAAKNIDTIPMDNSKFQKKLKHTIHRTFYVRTFSVLLVITLLAGILYFGTSALMNMLYYNPEHEKTFLVTEKNEVPREFSLLLTDFINMHFPGTYAYVLPDENFSTYTSKGFGCYDTRVKLFRSLDSIILNEEAANTFRIKWSKLKVDPGPLPLYHILNEFKNPDPSVTFQPGMPKLQEMQNEIKMLPDSAWLDVSISFEQYLSSDDIVSLINQYPDSDFNWIALKNQNFSITPQVSYGMGLYTISKDQFTEEAAKKYPFYYFDKENLNGDMLEKSYQSHLQLMIDHPEFVELMSTLFGDDISVENFQKRLNSAKKDWGAYGVRVNIGKKDLLKLLSSQPVSYLNINNVHISKYEK